MGLTYVFGVLIILNITLIGLTLYNLKKTEKIRDILLVQTFNIKKQQNSSHETILDANKKVLYKVEKIQKKIISNNDFVHEEEDDYLDEKNGEEKCLFIYKVSRMYPDLSLKELELCYLLKKDYSNKEIAEKLNVTYGTCRVYKHNIKARMKLENAKDLSHHFKNLLQS